ncbi:hypothetical protein PybrP1_009386 [[Pythium] brassicae (nom. inval.)]|nr:hypothetical protein PybrP1_009386 [[Pythium] brassicae (nom. inval.)]
MVFPALVRRAAASALKQQQQPQRAARSALRSSSAASFPPAARGVASLTKPQLPPHRAGDVTGIVAGVAIVGAIVGVGKMWWDASSAPSGASNRAPAAFQELSQAEVAGFFRELLAQVQQLFKQIPEIENAMRSYMKTNGIELEDAQFKQALMQQLFQMMEALEQEVVGKRRWSRQTVEAAFEKFAADAEVTALQQELQQVMQSHAKAEGITDATQAMEEFQHLYLEHVEQITTALLKSHGITQERAIQENEQLRQQVEQVYENQAKTFRSLGLKVDEQ